MSLSRKSVVRLTKLADYLETVPRNQFKLDCWTRGEIDAKHPCGTKACALGWATQLPFAKRDGVSLSNGGVITREGKYGFQAGSELFDLPQEDSVYLFSACGEDDRSTPKQVAKRIRQFIAERL